MSFDSVSPYSVKLSETRKGELSVFASAIFWSFFPIISIFALSSLPSLFAASFSAFFAGIFFAGVLTYQKKWHEWRIRSAWKDVFLGSFLIGTLFFGTVFVGLRFTTAGNASIVTLMEVLFTFLFFGLFKKEKHKRLHVWGAFLMVIGAAIILFPGEFVMRKGDLIILCATTIPPIGNFYQKEARKRVGSPFYLFVRNMLMAITLFLVALVVHPFPSMDNIKASLIFISLNGLVVFGFTKLLWIEGLHRMPVSKAIALEAISPLFTLFFAFFLLHEVPTFWQLGGLIPIIFGVYFLTKEPRNIIPPHGPY